MDTLETIFNRRSIRQYTDKQVTEDILLTLLKAAMYAPSAVNKQPWHFIVFRDRATMQQIIEVHPNASMLNQADVANARQVRYGQNTYRQMVIAGHF